ncbi:MAG: hypothetical protein AAB739_00355 [Patescibacteria group bacterium]
MNLSLRNIIDFQLSAHGVEGAAKLVDVKKIIDKISPGDLDLIVRSVEIPQGTSVQIVSIIRDAIRQVLCEGWIKN